MEDSNQFAFLPNSGNYLNTVSASTACNGIEIECTNTVPITIAEPKAAYPILTSEFPQTIISEQSVEFTSYLPRRNYEVWIPVKNHKRCIKSFMANVSRRTMASQEKENSMPKPKRKQIGMTSSAFHHPIPIQNKNKQHKSMELENSTRNSCDLMSAHTPFGNDTDTGGLSQTICPEIAETTIAAIDEMKVSLRTIMGLFHLPAEVAFLIYRVLKDNLGDLEQTSAKVAKETNM